MLVAEVSSFQLAFSRDVPARASRSCSRSRPIISTGTARSTTTSRPRRASPRARRATTCSCSTPTTPTRPRIAGGTRARDASASRAAPTPSGCDRDVDGALVVPGRRRRSRRCATMRRALVHDRTNALAAAAAALAVGATTSTACAPRSASYATLPHRVALVGEAGGVRWYDDSKATNPDATLRAVESFDSVVLLAGGRNKGLDLGARRAVGARCAASSRSARRRPRSRPRSPGVRPPVVTVAVDARRGARRGASSRSRATSCCSRRRARRSTRTTDYARTRRRLRGRGARRARGGGDRRMTVDLHHRDVARAGFAARRRSRGLRAGASRRAPAPLPRPPAYVVLCATVGVLNIVGPRDDPLGVVGRRAQRLRLVVVLLRPPADLGGRRSGRVPRRGARSTTTSGAGRAVAARRRRSRCAPSCSCPASGIYVDGSRRWLGVGALRMQPSEVAKLALLVLRRRRARAPGRPARTTGARGGRCSSMLGGARPARDAGARPRLDDRARADRFALLIVGGVRADHLREARRPPRAGARHRARVRGAVPAGPHARVPASVEGPGEHRLPDRAVADRARERRRERRRPRRGPRQVDVPPERAHRLHLRDHRRGARPRRLPARARAVRRASASSASASRAARPTGSACCSRPVSPRGSSGRPRSTSARSSACCRCRASRCRSCRPAARRS